MLRIKLCCRILSLDTSPTWFDFLDESWRWLYIVLSGSERWPQHPEWVSAESGGHVPVGGQAEWHRTGRLRQTALHRHAAKIVWGEESLQVLSVETTWLSEHRLNKARPSGENGNALFGDDILGNVTSDNLAWFGTSVLIIIIVIRKNNPVKAFYSTVHRNKVMLSGNIFSHAIDDFGVVDEYPKHILHLMARDKWVLPVSVWSCQVGRS